VVSHHTITVLGDACCTPVTCVLASDMDPRFLQEATNRLSEALRAGGHRIAQAEGGKAIEVLRECGIGFPLWAADSMKNRSSSSRPRGRGICSKSPALVEGGRVRQ